jgi:flagellar motor switch protein FliN/FliY
VPDKDAVPTDLRTIMKLRVPVIVQVGQRRAPLQDILGLGPGAIFELGKSSEDDLELLINNKVIGRGAAVKVGENFGIRINSIGDAKERVGALGGA